MRTQHTLSAFFFFFFKSLVSVRRQWLLAVCTGSHKALGKLGVVTIPNSSPSTYQSVTSLFTGLFVVLLCATRVKLTLERPCLIFWVGGGERSGPPCFVPVVVLGSPCSCVLSSLSSVSLLLHCLVIQGDTNLTWVAKSI